jgi:hypothetical protein
MLLFLSILNCRSKPDVLPAVPNKSSAIVLELGEPRLFGSTSLEKFWLVKFEKGVTKISELPLLESNFNSGSRLYLLNIEAGEYAIAGGYRFQKGNQGSIDTNYYYVFDRAHLEKTKFSVKPNQVQIVGKFKVEFNGGKLEVDPDMDNLGEKIVGNFKASLLGKIGVGIATALLGGSITAPGYANIVKVNTPEDLAEIEKEVKLDFAETKWSEIPLYK